MRRLLAALGCLLALAGAAPGALALGTGPLEVRSALNEPFAARIPLLATGGLLPEEIRVGLADAPAFDRARVDRAAALLQLQFSVVQDRSGALAIDIRSRQPVREPALEFLVRIESPDGSLMQKYAVLLDPRQP